jgi:hypothetical protein
MKLGSAGKVFISILLIAMALGASYYSSTFQYNDLKDNGRLQGQITGKLAQVAGVWVSVKIASGIISVVQTIQVEGSIPVIGGLAVAAQPLGWAEVVDNTLDHISNVCLWAMGALALQKVLLAISIWVSLRIIVPICALLVIIALWNKKYTGQLKRIAGGIVIITSGICLAIPLSLELSNVVEAGILSRHIDETITEISDTSKEINEKGGEANDVNLLRRIGGGIASFFDSIKNYFDSLIDKAIDFIICFIVTHIIIPIGTLFFLKYLVSMTLRFIGFSGNYRAIPLDDRKSLEPPAEVQRSRIARKA